MNRREFLEMLGMGGVALATPKFIFDYGANLYKTSDDLITFQPVGFDLEAINALHAWAIEKLDDLMLKAHHDHIFRGRAIINTKSFLQ